MATTVYLVRHAQARPRPEVAECDWALSDRGREQARELVPVLAALGIEHVYTSPFRRCRDTLQPFADAAGLPLIVHDGVRERRLSDRWIGDFREVWQRSWADFSYALEGGESSLCCRDRVAGALAEIVRRHAGRTIAVGSHGYAIGLLLTTIDTRCGIAEASAFRTPEILKLVGDGASLVWDQSFAPGEAFDRLATDFRHTPGIVA